MPWGPPYLYYYSPSSADKVGACCKSRRPPHLRSPNGLEMPETGAPMLDRGLVEVSKESFNGLEGSRKRAARGGLIDCLVPSSGRGEAVVWGPNHL